MVAVIGMDAFILVMIGISTSAILSGVLYVNLGAQVDEAASTIQSRVAFQASAERHRDRLPAADWNLVLGIWQTYGPLTVGEHTGIALAEWHLHAWDFARIIGEDHTPADPETVAAACAHGGGPGGTAPDTALTRERGELAYVRGEFDARRARWAGAADRLTDEVTKVMTDR